MDEMYIVNVKINKVIYSNQNTPQHCQRAVDEATFQKMVDRQVELLSKERARGPGSGADDLNRPPQQAPGEPVATPTSNVQAAEDGQEVRLEGSSGRVIFGAEA